MEESVRLAFTCRRVVARLSNSQVAAAMSAWYGTQLFYSQCGRGNNTGAVLIRSNQQQRNKLVRLVAHRCLSRIQVQQRTQFRWPG
jgi:hypothetical protein